MITYNWRAEFSQEENDKIRVFQRRAKAPAPFKSIEQLSNVSLVAEMANALDRYEAILNEQEQPRFQAYRDKDGAIKVINNAKIGRDEDDNS